jgi:hypothetical protein
MGNKEILVNSVDKTINSASDFPIEDFSSGEWKKYDLVKK